MAKRPAEKAAKATRAKGGKKRVSASRKKAKPAKKSSSRKPARVAKAKPKRATKSRPARPKTAKRPPRRPAARPPRKAKAAEVAPAPPPPPARPVRSIYEVPPQVQNAKLMAGQIRELRLILESERDRLIQDLSRLGGSNLDDMPPDQPNRFGNHLADVASDNQMNETLMLQSGVEGAQLREISEALEAIERRRYGICERCGANIGWDRLQAKPHAHYCIVCRSHLERTADASRL